MTDKQEYQWMSVKAINIISVVLIVLMSAFLYLAIYNYCEHKKWDKERQRLEKENTELTEKLNYYIDLNKPFVDKKDSIEYVIHQIDSTIVNIINDYEYEKHILEDANDTYVVYKFKELVWSDQH